VAPIVAPDRAPNPAGHRPTGNQPPVRAIKRPRRARKRHHARSRGHRPRGPGRDGPPPTPATCALCYARAVKVTSRTAEREKRAKAGRQQGTAQKAQTRSVRAGGGRLSLGSGAVIFVHHTEYS